MRLVTGLVKDRLLGCMGDKVSIDKELMELGRVAEGDRGGRARKKVVSGGIR